MSAGRPILLAPLCCSVLTPNRILIAWKDTSEARKAVQEAFPLLTQATELTIVEIVSSEVEKDASGERVADVAKWLQRHNVSAATRVELSAKCEV